MAVAAPSRVRASGRAAGKRRRAMQQAGFERGEKEGRGGRWAVERLLDGWLPTADRAATDPKQLVHRDLVPWEELEASDKEKDAAQVDALIAQTRKDES